MVLGLIGVALGGAVTCDEVVGMVELGLDEEMVLRAVEGSELSMEDAACLVDAPVPAAVKFWAARAVSPSEGDPSEQEPAEAAPVQEPSPVEAPRAIDEAPLPPVELGLVDAGGGRVAEVIAAERVLYLGVDHTLVQMVGSDFDDPGAIYPGHIDQWNSRMAEEQAMRALAWALDRPVKPAISHLEAVHAGVDAEARARSGPGGDNLVGELRLSGEELAGAVGRYELPDEDAVGMVWVMESMLKEAETACMHAVFFELKGGSVLHSVRTCQPASGMTFSSHWQAPLDLGVQQLRRERIAWERQGQK
jgi:hypothetical protein